MCILDSYLDDLDFNNFISELIQFQDSRESFLEIKYYRDSSHFLKYKYSLYILHSTHTSAPNIFVWRELINFLYFSYIQISYYH